MRGKGRGQENIYLNGKLQVRKGAKSVYRGEDNATHVLQGGGKASLDGDRDQRFSGHREEGLTLPSVWETDSKSEAVSS